MSGLTRRMFGAACIGGVAAAATPALAAKEPVYRRWGVAIRGTDPVAYFTEGEPVEGSRDFTYEWNGAEWRFASAGNRDAFSADPAAYAPEYGGYCAYAVANGYTASTVPEAWHIFEGKLYLNYSLDVRDLWRADIPGHIERADANWPGVLD